VVTDSDVLNCMNRKNKERKKRKKMVVENLEAGDLKMEMVTFFNRNPLL